MVTKNEPRTKILFDDRYIRFHARQKYSSMAVKRFVYIPFHKDIYNCCLIYVLTRVLLSEKGESGDI
jgi:hypothetical protein